MTIIICSKFVGVAVPFKGVAPTNCDQTKLYASPYVLLPSVLAIVVAVVVVAVIEPYSDGWTVIRCASTQGDASTVLCTSMRIATSAIQSFRKQRRRITVFGSKSPRMAHTPCATVAARCCRTSVSRLLLRRQPPPAYTLGHNFTNNICMRVMLNNDNLQVPYLHRGCMHWHASLRAIIRDLTRASKSWRGHKLAKHCQETHILRKKRRFRITRMY